MYARPGIFDQLIIWRSKGIGLERTDLDVLVTVEVKLAGE